MADTDKRRDQVEEEHERIRTLVGQVERLDDVAGLQSAMGELIPLLESHFASEPECMRAIVSESAPHSIDKLESIMDEHGMLLECARALVDKAGKAGGDYRAVEREVADFIERLRDHETRETELLSQAVTLDLGAGD